MTQDEVKDVSNNPKFRDNLKNIITKSVNSVQFSNDSLYKIGYCEKNQLNGVLQYVFGKWIWGWHNTINTNYSCLYVIIKYINEIFNKKITYDDFINYKSETLLYFDECLTKSAQYLFTPYSPEFNEMIFATQFSWCYGKISEISTIYTLSKNETSPITYKLSFDRGERNDLFKSCDFYMITTGSTLSVQNKKVYNKEFIDLEGYYLWDFYIKKENMMLVNCMTIDNSEFIYLFKYNENKSGMILKNNKNKFRIHQSLLKKKMKKEGKDITNLMIKINQYCCNNHIKFYYDIENIATKNSIEELIDNGEKVIKFTLIDIHDENLFNMLSKFYEKLKITP